mgnify:CR=1 FL=1
MMKLTKMMSRLTDGLILSLETFASVVKRPLRRLESTLYDEPLTPSQRKRFTLTLVTVAVCASLVMSVALDNATNVTDTLMDEHLNDVMESKGGELSYER